jgi:cytochrome c oxidase cbb3-type subunit I/II
MAQTRRRRRGHPPHRRAAPSAAGAGRLRFLVAQPPLYNDRLVRRFALAALVWGVVGLAAGMLIALELAFWPANAGPSASFGRMRPVHTTVVLFAFAGNLVFAGVYYSSQRLLGVRVPSDRLAALHFWSWQLVAAAGAATLALGHSQGLRFGEMEWPLDLALALSWLAFAASFAGMVRRRTRPRLAPPIWFYTAAIIGVAVGHVAGSLAVPVSALKSYPLLAGVQQALVQAWSADGAIAFLLLVPFFGFLYDVLPRAAGRPMHSHRLIAVQFWSLLFALGWAAPRHLLDTALPEWAQAAGAAFGLLLWAPTCAAAVNGALTLRAGWTGLRADPVIRFLAGALLFGAAASIEASILSTRTADQLVHYTDWTIGHVHLTALGWTGFLAAALLYWIVPRLWGAPLRSRAAAGAHLYMASVGVLLDVSSMWIAGATQATMLRAEGLEGGLAYSFIEAVNALRLTTWARVAGGALYAAGFALMVWNLVQTIRAGRAVDGAIEAPAEIEVPAGSPPGLFGVLVGKPVAVCAALTGLVIAAGFANPIAALVCLVVAALLALGAMAGAALRDPGPSWHERLERRGLALAILAAAAFLVGGAVEMAPLFASPPEPIAGESDPYSPLQLEGRDVYVAEGCQSCHSQMIRPFLWEVARYGEVSSATESLRDHPPLWGSRRIGPDLARIGGRYPNLWHHDHLVDPRAVTLGSTMPSYRHLIGQVIDLGGTPAKMRALRAAGVPYGDDEIARAGEAAIAEGRAIAADLRRTGSIEIAPESAMVALIAYLQRLGQPR